MSKKTDYQRLYKNEKRDKVIAQNEILRLNGIIEMQAGIIRDLQKVVNPEDSSKKNESTNNKG